VLFRSLIEHELLSERELLAHHKLDRPAWSTRLAEQDSSRQRGQQRESNFAFYKIDPSKARNNLLINKRST